MKKLIVLLTLSYCFAQTSFAQGTLKGKLLDSTNNKPIGLATVTVFQAADTVIITYRMSNGDGDFKIPGLPLNLNCRVVVTVSGYAGYRKEFILSDTQKELDLGSLHLAPSVTSLDEVVVFAERPPVIIKKDTVEFNASAFKTLPNALVEDLLKKLPGVQVDKEGNIVVNGKPVNKILVDGKSFFGDDPKMATRNLPANVIDKIQVTDDKEEMLRSGDDNPNNIGKVVNITLKKGIKKGWFGKMYAGAGTENIKEFGGIANIYRDTLQISLLGYLNNLNKPGFSYSELMQAGGLDRNRSNSNSNSTSTWRNPNGSGVSINGVNFGGMQNYGGVATSKGIGINLNHTPNKKRSFFFQYFRGNVEVDRTNRTRTEQYNADTVVSNQTVLGGDIETNAHNFGVGARFKPDSLTNILVNANYTIGLQDENRNSSIISNNNILGPLSTGEILQYNPGKTYYYRQNVSLTRLSAKKAGRRFNLYHALDINNRFNDYSTNSSMDYIYPVQFDSNYSQLRKERIPRTDAILSFNYSEPFTKKITLRLGGRYEYSLLNNTVNTFNLDSTSGKYNIENPTLSNHFKRDGNRFFVTTGLEFKWKKFIITPSLKALTQSFSNVIAGISQPVKQQQKDLLPMFSFNYKQLSINYSKDIVMPGYMYFMPVTDNSNPYFISKGNLNLKPMKRDNLSANYYFNNPKTNWYASMYTNLSFTNNDIVQSINVNDQGVQTSQPINVNGSKNFYSNYNVSKQYKNNPKFIYSWNIGGYYSINKNKLFYNGQESWQTTYNFQNWGGVNLNFNDKFEFNTSFTNGSNFNHNSNKVYKKVKLNYLSVENEVIVRWFKRVIFETQINYQHNSNLPTTESRNIVRWNAAVNVTMLKSEALVFKLSVFDILNKNIISYVSVNRNMVTYYQSNVLPQYVLGTFTYNVRPYGASKKVGGRERLFNF